MGNGEALIFLDIDGVLNDHKHVAHGYSGIDDGCVVVMNWLLARTDAKIVISSAWRYMIHKNEMTLRGFEYMLITHGLNVKDRLVGITDMDDVPAGVVMTKEFWTTFGLLSRPEQILKAVARFEPRRWVVIDDLPLVIDRLVRTDPTVGLTMADAEKALVLLEG